MRYKIHIHKVYNVSLIFLQDTVQCFVLFSFGMSLAASSARQGFALLMYRQLTSRTTNHRTYLLKVGQPDPLKVNILHTGWKPTTGFSCGRSTHSLVQLCLRRDEAHAIVHFHFSSPHIISHLLTTNCNSLHQYPLSTTTIHPFYPGDSMLIF